MMKMIDLIWPDNWGAFIVRVALLFFLIFLWAFTAYLKYFVLQVSGVLHVFGLLLMLIIWAYLFNKTIGLSLTSIDYESDDLDNQVIRSIVFFIAVFSFLLIVFIADW